MVGWHNRLNGHEFEQPPGDGEGQASLVCCSPCSPKELDTTYRLSNGNNLIAEAPIFSLRLVHCLAHSKHSRNAG